VIDPTVAEAKKAIRTAFERAANDEATLLLAVIGHGEQVTEDHPDTLTTRNNIAAWTGRSGDARKALRLFQALLPDQERVLGPDHPDTLRTREWIEALRDGL